MKIYPIPFCQWRDVWLLMLYENFPHTPLQEHEAQAAFAKVHLYGAWEEEELVFAIVIGKTEPHQLGSHFLDVVCTQKMRGKWATKGLLTYIKKLLFQVHHASVVLAETHNSQAFKAALAGGFTPVQVAKGRSALVLQPSGLLQEPK